MGVRDLLSKIGQRVHGRIEKSFGYDADRVSMEVRREILDKVEKAQADSIANQTAAQDSGAGGTP